MDQAKQVTKLQQCLAFFASVIKCGEPWTETCERAYREALAEPLPEKVPEPAKSCKGAGRFDDRGFPDKGQPAFDFYPCPGCEDCPNG